VKLPAGKILITGVASHATALVEHPEQVGQKNVIAGTESGLEARVDPQIPWAKRRALRNSVPTLNFER